MNCCCSNPVCREKGCQAQQQLVHQQHPQTYSTQCPICQDKDLVINYSERLLLMQQERDRYKQALEVISGKGCEDIPECSDKMIWICTPCLARRALQTHEKE